MKYLIFFILFIFLMSCNKEEKKPDYLMEEEQFIEVLTEFQTAEALVRRGYHRTQDSLIPNDSVYASLFRKLSLTQAKFDSNYQYYSNRPKEFEKIYEQVITNLSTRSAEVMAKSNKTPEEK